MGKFKPIVFSTQMAAALLDGSKTQTRRCVKLGPEEEEAHEGDGGDELHAIRNEGGDVVERVIRPRYKPGDILYVRESYRETGERLTPYAYKADETPLMLLGENGQTISVKYRYKPSIHMPKAAARIFLRVTGISVEKLAQVTDSDSIAEGFKTRREFLTYWDLLNTKRGYSNNTDPFVWKITFERTDKPYGW